MSPGRFRWALFGLMFAGIIPFVRPARRATTLHTRLEKRHRTLAARVRSPLTDDE